MAQSLKALKAKKKKLLKKAGIRNANLDSIRAREAEKRKLKAEIYALEHPESERARRALKSAAIKFGRSAKEISNRVANNAVRIQKAKNEAARKERMEERKLELARLRAAKSRNTAKKKKTVKRKSYKKKK